MNRVLNTGVEQINEIKQDWLLNRFIRYKFVSYGKQRLPHSSSCNRNTLKLSYSCMPNIASIISSHNKAILTKHINTKPTVCDTCNCRQKMSCPLDGKCLAEGVV